MGVILELTQVHVSLLTEFKQHSQTQLHREESLFFVKGMLMSPLVTAGVGDDAAQELQMTSGSQALEDVEGTMPSRPATQKDPGTLDQIVLDPHSLTHFPSHLTQWCHKFSLTTATWWTEPCFRLHVSSWEQTPPLEPYTRQLCQTPRK